MMTNRFYSLFLPRSMVILVVIILSSTGLSRGEIGLDFEIPTPPGARLLETRPVSIGGRKINTSLYESKQELKDIIEYYQRFFKENNFKLVLDEKGRPENRRLLRFKKEELMVSIAFLEKGEKREIVVGKYLQPEGLPEIDDTPVSLKDFPLPQRDVAGRDLRIVPRPPESVRWMCEERGSRITLLYASSLSAERIREFYRQQMYAQGWQMGDEIPISEAVKAYKQASGKKHLDLQMPFKDAENLEEIISGAYFLEFRGKVEGRETKVDITIFSNFIDKKLGSIVQIEYGES